MDAQPEIVLGRVTEVMKKEWFGQALISSAAYCRTLWFKAPSHRPLSPEMTIKVRCLHSGSPAERGAICPLRSHQDFLHGPLDVVKIAPVLLDVAHDPLHPRR
jgi:hypothetical protein